MVGHNHLITYTHHSGLELNMHEYRQEATYGYLQCGVPGLLVNEMSIRVLKTRTQGYFRDAGYYLPLPPDMATLQSELPPVYCAALFRTWDRKRDETKEGSPSTELALAWFQHDRSAETPPDVLDALLSCDWYSLATEFEW